MDRGGHHYDYTRLVAQAAVDLGIQPVVVANRKLTKSVQQDFQQFGDVHNVFRRSTYTAYSHLAGLKELAAGSQPNKTSKLLTRPEDAKGFLAIWQANRARQKRIKQRGRIIRNFAQDCDTLFSKAGLQDTDQVFFTTVSELEFMGLAAFLADQPGTMAATWHVQFHFSMFTGRTAEFVRQSKEEGQITGCFQHALSRAPYHEIRTYTTSDELAEQYNTMQLMAFASLPYPINPRLFCDRNTERQTGPLRMAVAGGVRREKGQKSQVTTVLSEIWDKHISTGNLKVDLQTSKPGSFPGKGSLDSGQVSAKQLREHVNILPHPLPDDQYVQLIENASFGLFCYDSRRYFARRAGIMGEFLANGKPVIVPAGCWLANQLTEANCQHVEKLMRQTKAKQELELSDLSCPRENVPQGGGIISFGKQRNPFVAWLDKEQISNEKTDAVVVQFQWRWPKESGTFVELDLICYDEQGKAITHDKQIVSMRGSQASSLVYLRTSSDFHRLKLRFRNAYMDTSLSLCDLRLTALDFRDNPTPPRSAVGVVAADQAGVIAAIDEMVQHYDHYRATAIEFSRDWISGHDPQRTVATLMPSTTTRQRAA